MFYLYSFVVMILMIALPVALGYHYQHHRQWFTDATEYCMSGFLIAIAILLWPVILCLALVALPVWILFKIPIWIDERKQAKNKSQ